ncbi:hypothetical protein EYR40_007074 [Pleurotus pulmonarius]|nr:hypothetical protein EYR36_003657 [Pleurotus pulmonarius]KAF4599968.1 hypothetical protein EYR40_007074 [Pleurotus pulmonarius]
MDVAKLFQGSGSSSTPSAPSTSETQSPSVRSSNLPPQSSHQPPPQQHQGQSSQSGQPSQMSGHHFTPFVPGMRQQNGGPGGPGGVPRSPSYNRSMTNGNSSRPTGPNGPNGPSPIPPSMSSPRLQSHPHAGQPAPMAPPPQMQWPPYPYYPPYDYGYMYMPQQMPPPPNSLGPPQPGMAMSPRTGPIPLQSPTPGTPTPPHAVPHIPHAPHPPPLSHTSSSSISGTPSTPTTPSTGNIPLSAARLNMGAASFVPNSGRGPTKISIKNPNDGAEIKIENWKKGSPGPGPSPASSTPPPTTFNSPGNRQPIRLESEDARKKRIAEEEEKQRKVKEAEQAKREAEETAKREKERKEKEDKERKEKEEEERRKKEEEKEKELKRLEEEKIRKEQEERERKAKEEKEREEERLRLEEEERARKLEEAERKRKEEEDRLLKEKEEKERAEREAEEKAKAQAEAEEKAKVEATAKQAAVEEPEEGEVVEADAPVLNGIPKPREKESLRIDTADSGRKRPGPLNLTIAKGVPISAAPMSALATARRIEDLGSVQYPEGIKSPSTELNANAQDSKFRYDRDFLLQFMKICTEKPDMLPPLDAIGLQPSDQISYSMTRGGSGRHRQSSGPVSVSRQASTGPNFNQLSGFNKASPVNTFTMGQFATPGAAKMSSEDRFAMSSRSASGPAGMAFGRPAQMQRTASQGGPGPMNKQRTRSKRGEDRGGNKANSGSQHSHGSNYNNSGAMAQSSLGLEPVVPLQQSANRWDRKALAADPDSPEIVDRKVKGLLNKLTMEKFDSISDQIIEWANRSEKEKDGRTLIQVIRLVFEKATDEATWSEMYARLCRKMMEQISPKVQDDGIKNAEGKPITGGHLFRKYLLNRCQEDFERGWVAKEATAAAAASKALEDKAAKAANDKAKENAKEGESTDEVALYSDEYYAAQKAKRQGLGLIKFIGELFKLQMLTERIMHECVKKLLGNVDNPEEEEIESLCKLLSTVGQLLDTPKARAHMDVYFSRMKDLIKSPHVSSRMQFMLQDVIELRERRWVSRNQVAAPTTLAAVHEAAAKEKASAEKEALQKQQLSMSRGGSRRGGERNELTGPDGWTTRPPSKAGDLSQFGKISKPATMNFGPSSVFANKKGIEKKEPISRTSSSSNMFSMLSGNPEVAMSESGASKSSRPPSRKASIDLSQSGAPDGQRRRLNLLPRTKPVEEVEAGPSQEGESEEGEEVEAPTMSDADAKKKIDEDVKEFFGVRNLDEAEVYFSGLPSTHHERLVDKLVSKAIESKEADATLVADFFTRAASKSLCSPTSFEEGFFGMAEFLEDIAIDAPKAWDFMALMVKGASLNGDSHGRIASKTADANKLLALLS